MPQCTAKSKQSQERCKKDACVGRNVCHIHGGKTRQGVATTNYRHGKYSKFLPLTLAADYQRARDDPDLHSLTDEIALSDARLCELLRRVEHNDLGAAWTHLDAAYQTFQQRRSTGDVAGMGKALSAMEAQIGRGKADYLLWREISEQVKLLGTLRLQEHKRLVDLESMMTAQQAQLFFGLIQQAVHKAVTTYADTDSARRILAAIQADLVRLAGRAVDDARVLAG